MLAPIEGQTDPAVARSGGTETARRERIGVRIALPVAGRSSRFVIKTSVRRDAGPDVAQTYGVELPWAIDLGVDYRRPSDARAASA